MKFRFFPSLPNDSLTSRLGPISAYLGLGLLCSILSSCGPGGRGTDTGYGPFDENGNYIEAWADNPTKWNRKPLNAAPSGSQGVFASNDNPPSNSTPITGNTPSNNTPAIAPPKPTVTTTTKPTTVATKPVVKPVVKPKPKVAAVKPKPKPKPKPAATRVTVKKGDTLYALARRYGTTVTAIQQANGIKGSNLTIGKSLSIPRK